MSREIVRLWKRSFYPVVALLTLLRGPVSIFGMVILIGVVDVLKRLFGEMRPDHSDRRSFPSGHSATSWFLVVLFAEAHVWNVVIALWASAVTISRVVFKRHFVHDVIAGAALGILFALVLKKLFPVWYAKGWRALQRREQN